MENEAAELNWTQQSGRTLAGKPLGPRAQSAGVAGSSGYVLVKETFEGGSGRLGGDSDALKHVSSRGKRRGGWGVGGEWYWACFSFGYVVLF